MKVFAKDIADAHVQTPVILELDGHSTRYSLDTYKFCLENGMYVEIYEHHTDKLSHLLMLPPNATHLYQALDKLFTYWHEKYLSAIQRWKADHSGMLATRDVFLHCFEEAWPGWCTPDQIRNAFNRVGWGDAGVDYALFGDDAECFKISATFQEDVRMKNNRSLLRILMHRYLRLSSRATMMRPMWMPAWR